MHETISRFQTASLYSNEEIYSSLGVGNTRGVRVNLNEDRTVKRIAIFTSIPTPRQLAENPYHDRLEGDILIYTGEGKAGEQSVSGANARIIEQLQQKFQFMASFKLLEDVIKTSESDAGATWDFLNTYVDIKKSRSMQENKHERSGFSSFGFIPHHNA